MPKIFISYRRIDTQDDVVALHRHLVEEFGQEAVFLDTQGISHGSYFDQTILTELYNADVILVVIGPAWLNVREETDPTKRRLDNPSDWVRREVARALERHMIGEALILPILVRKAHMPGRTELPEDIADLYRIEGYRVRSGVRMKEDLRKLIKVIRERAAEQQRRNRTGIVPIVLFILLLVGVIGAAALALRPPQERDEAILFLMDTSSGMNEQLDDSRTRFDAAQEAISGIVNSGQLDLPGGDTWLGIQTAGGGDSEDCEQVGSLISASGQEIAPSLLNPIYNILPGGNTSYVEGFHEIRLHLQLEEVVERRSKYLIVFMASDRVSSPCRRRGFDLQAQVEALRDQDVEVAICGFTFFNNAYEFDAYRRSLESVGVESLHNIESPEDISRTVDIAVRRIQAGRLQLSGETDTPAPEEELTQEGTQETTPDLTPEATEEFSPTPTESTTPEATPEIEAQQENLPDQILPTPVPPTATDTLTPVPPTATSRISTPTPLPSANTPVTPPPTDTPQISTATSLPTLPPPPTSTPLDSDADGVPDSVDACPIMPGPSANNGCPIPTNTPVPTLPPGTDPFAMTATSLIATVTVQARMTMTSQALTQAAPGPFELSATAIIREATDQALTATAQASQ